MKVHIPKDMRGIVFPRLFTVVLSGFDIDLLLPQLFFRILASGKDRAGRINDPKNLTGFVNELAAHPDVLGFQDAGGRRALERLVRTEMVVMGGMGRGGRRGEQILSTVPYTLLTHKVGFPAEGSRQRGVDGFLYHILRDTSRADDQLRRDVKAVFGKGVIIGSQGNGLGGHYDGTTELDTLTRLSIAFLDGFETVSMGREGSRRQSPACPSAAREMGKDLLRYLFGYGERMPPQALTYNFLALINFELFIYSLKLVHAVNTLVQDASVLPAAMQESQVISRPELYLDFTAVPGSLSQRMAADCVRRDIEAYQRFLSSNLLLRQLDRYVEKLRRIPRWRSELEAILDTDTSGPRYFQGIVQLLEHPILGERIQNLASGDEDEIQQETITYAKVAKLKGKQVAEEDDYVEGEDDDLIREQLKDLVAQAETDVERVVMLLVEAQSKEALNHYIQWYWSVGGLRKRHGLLEGNIKGRHSWRYAPSNDLLAVLVQLTAVRLADSNNRDALGNVKIQPIRLQDFLSFLETRFGILVDRPPATFVGADYTAAARENLRAMLRRLRQMGIFSDLSDDFTVQRLHPPYADDTTSAREA